MYKRQIYILLFWIGFCGFPFGTIVLDYYFKWLFQMCIRDRLKGRVVTRLLYQETVSPTGGIKMCIRDRKFNQLIIDIGVKIKCLLQGREKACLLYTSRCV